MTEPTPPSSYSLPATMQALRITTYGSPYTLTSIPVPSVSSLRPHDLLVKIAVASHCHTDTIIRLGAVPSIPLPLTASHEGSGTVVAVGSSVSEDGSFKVGDRVMCGIPLGLCGACGDCAGAGHYRQYCAHIDGHIGIQVDGVFAEYAVVDSRTSTVIPDGVSLLAAAPLGCAGRTAWRAVKEAGLKPGQWLGIVGSGGGLGHLAVQFAVKMQLKVVGIEARDEGLELTREMGADVVVDARRGKDEVVKEVGKAVLGDDGKDVDHNGLFATGGVAATVNLSDANDAAGLACAITKMHGLVVQVAQPLEVKIPFMELILRDVRIKGSLQCSGEESEEMLQFVAEHGVKVKMTPFYGLDQVEELEKVVSSGKLQGRAAIIVDPHQLQHEKEIVRH